MKISIHFFGGEKKIFLTPIVDFAPLHIFHSRLFPKFGHNIFLQMSWGDDSLRQEDTFLIHVIEGLIQGISKQIKIYNAIITIVPTNSCMSQRQPGNNKVDFSQMSLKPQEVLSWATSCKILVFSQIFLRSVYINPATGINYSANTSLQGQ